MMSKFENIHVIKKANIYFDGQVTSRTVEFSDGSIKTLGIMMSGEYNFSTDKAELMEILQGRVVYKLAASEEWIEVKANQSFNVPSQSSFDIKAMGVVDYCCSYLDD